MQMHLRLDPDPVLVRIRDRLSHALGPLTAWMRRDPVSQLVRSMIGSRTYDAVSEAVFAQLRARFTPWSKLADARFDEVAPIVAPVTYAEDKTHRLIAATALVRRKAGALRLDFLEHWPLEEAMAWLQELPGVGQKVAASVLNFSTLRRRVFVVDGHILRVATRLGLNGREEDADACREAVMDAAPDVWTADDFMELHVLMKRLGQTVCRPSQPDCPACPVEEFCQHSPKGSVRREALSVSKPSPPSAALAAANENTPSSGGGLDAYLRRRIARLERMGVSKAVLAAAGVSLRREIDDAFLDRRLPAGAHQSAGARMEDGAAALALALAVTAALPGQQRLRALVIQEGDARREHGELHGPGLEAFGLNPREAAFVRARDGPQALEVADEALRGLAAPLVLLELRRGAVLADLSVTRRFNLQARRAGLFLFLITPNLLGTSAASTRWRVSACASAAPRRRVGLPTFRLDLVRNRHGRTGSWIAQWSAHERRFLSARAIASEVLGEEGLDAVLSKGTLLSGGDVRAGRDPAVPAPLAAAALHRPRAAGAA